MTNDSKPNEGRGKSIAQAISIAAMFTGISLWITGYQYGLSNNAFHIPYVLRLAEQPEFRADVLYNSLVNYTSVVWPALRAIATEQNIERVFLGAFLVSRFLTFYALYVFVAGNIRVPFKTLAACTAMGVIVVCPWAVGVSTIGGHGLLINYFTQSELTWPFIFWALWSLQRAHFFRSGLAIGIVFAINAFIGVWMVWTALFAKFFAPLAVSPRNFVCGVAAFLLMAGPVMVWVLSTGNIASGDANFSYVEYARVYNPFHYLIEVSSVEAVVRFLLLSTAGMLACRHIDAPRYWVGVQLALLLFFFFGAWLPYVVDSKFVIVLHFLRSDGVEQFLAVILICTAAASLLFAATARQGDKALAIFILTLLIAPYPTHSSIDMAFIVAALLMTFRSGGADVAAKRSTDGLVETIGRRIERWHVAVLYGAWIIASLAFSGFNALLGGKFAVLGVGFTLFELQRSRRDGRQVRLVVLSMLVVLGGWSASAASKWARQYSTDEHDPRTMAFRQMTDWVRASRFSGPFLVKAGDWGDEFQLLARRRVWVDWKQGGAVPWAPHFYRQWSSRYAEVARLHTAADFLAYARTNRIENVVMDADDATCPTDSTAQQRFGSFTFCHLPIAEGQPVDQAAKDGRLPGR